MGCEMDVKCIESDAEDGEVTALAQDYSSDTVTQHRSTESL